MVKKVTVIEATQKVEVTEQPNLRVCAYCRVSTTQEEQLNSFAAQVAYYTEYINKSYNWIFSGIYADEGISGKSKEKRTDFMRLLKDCENHQIDMILTKSISRFARNTTDCIGVIRKLKELGIGVYFEKENINTLSEESELILSILASIAEEESRSISSNIIWSNQKRYSQGKMGKLPKIIGYDVNEKGQYNVNEAEARIVKNIFTECINGKGSGQIARALNEEKVPTLRGGKWNATTVLHMLHNEKYCGDIMLQKTIKQSNPPYKVTKNQGELPKYYIEDNHQAIISRENFYKVQQLITDRAKKAGLTEQVLKKRAGKHLFTKKLVCGKCNRTYHHATLGKRNSKRSIWRCSSDKEGSCGNNLINDEVLVKATMRVINKLYCNIETLLIPYRRYLEDLHSLRDATKEEEINTKIKELNSQIQTLTQLSSRGILNPILYNKQVNELASQIKEIKTHQVYSDNKVYKNYNNVWHTNNIIQELKKLPHLVGDLEPELINILFDKIIIYSNCELGFVLKNDMNLKENIGGDYNDF